MWVRIPPAVPLLDHEIDCVASSPVGIGCADIRGRESAYIYLLGLYLGDGCISRSRNVWRLRIFQDQRYVELIEACREAVTAVSRGRTGLVRKTGCVEISSYWKHWP